jgi:hypothetical protein
LLLGGALTALITAFASTIVANVYADKQQSEAIRTTLSTQLSLESVKAYNSAFVLAKASAERRPPADLGARRDRALSDWNTAAAQVDVGFFAHFSGTRPADQWKAFSSAVFALVSAAYTADRDRSTWTRRVHAFLAQSGVKPPAAPASSRDPWVVLGCAEPGCARSPEWVSYFRWACQWVGLTRGSLVRGLFQTDVENPG